MRIDVLTIFPEFFAGPFGTSLVGKAVEAGTLDLRTHDLRDFTHDRHRTVDDAPYGGGAGMVTEEVSATSSRVAITRYVPGTAPAV